MAHHRSLFALVLVLGFFGSLLAVSPSAGAQAEAVDDGLVRLDSVSSGTLLLVTDRPGLYVPAPALTTDIEIAVSGSVARTIVSQRFENVAGVFVEGKYVFPLPEGAAVDTLRMQVGSRWIEGAIEGREQARQIYEEAKSAGQVTSLVEQSRPNVFTTSVANIAPGADVVIQIEYQQSLAPHRGVFGLRVPLVVAPRYVPEEQLVEVVTLGSDGWHVETRADADAAHGKSTVVDPRNDDVAAQRNPVEISIDLDAGFPLGEVESLYHQVEDRRVTETSSIIELDGPVPSDRDFYLSWKARDLRDPYAAMYTETLAGDTHYVAMLSPPSLQAVTGASPAREVIFVQDTSGSMSGISIEQARAGLELALLRLQEDDLFNVVEFNTTFTTFADEPVAATAANIDRAVRFVRALKADHGTEMRPALARALRDNNPGDDRLRQVIFLTDGLVTNEEEMLELIEDDLGRSRLFTVGIGSAPNSYFMTAAARSGRGSTVFIGDIREVDEQMQALFSKIETPAIVDLKIEGLPEGVEISPSPIPDLYVGDPIVLTARVPAGTELDSVSVAGQRGRRGWRLDMSLAEAESRPGISKLWARESIRDLEASRTIAAIDEAQSKAIDDAILQVAMEFGLVSRMTSLVAVDLEITRPADAENASTDVPTNLPAGWDPAIFFGSPDAAQDEDVEAAPFSTSIVERLEAVEVMRQSQLAHGPSGNVPLPATGADWQIQALIGAALVALGAWTFVRPRREERR